MPKNISELSGRKGLEDNLFKKITEVSKASTEYIPSAFGEIAEEFLVGKANILGTASFYDFTREENLHKKVFVCNGSACKLAGTQDAVHSALASRFQSHEIGEMCCLGRCHENSAFHFQGKNYSGNGIEEFMAGKETPAQEKYLVSCLGTPVLTAPEPDNQTCAAWINEMRTQSPEQILNQIKISGVRGRGGAGFPMHIKLQTVAGMQADRKYIVCNADEGDPGAFSDRYLMEERPRILLLGMMIAGYVTGAEYGVLYVRGEYPESIRILQEVILEWGQLGLLDTFRCKIIEGQGAYICGEETALLNSIEGQRPEVRVRPPFPAQSGLFNRPTIVNNVETLACLPFIFRHGGEKFASIGIGRSTGTKLISLDGHFNQPGIVEADMGTPLSQVIEEAGKGFRVPIKAMHIGGPLGGLVPTSSIPQLTVDFESFQQNGFLLGHASVICIPQDYPLINYIHHLFEFTAHESCGKCFPCRLGSTRGKELLQNAIKNNIKISSELFNDLLDTMETGSLCALGGGLPLPVKNALTYFSQELKPHFV